MGIDAIEPLKLSYSMIDFFFYLDTRLYDNQTQMN